MNRNQSISNLKTVVIGGWGHAGGMLGELSGAGVHPHIVAMAPVTADDNPDGFRKRFQFCRSARLYRDYRRMLAETKPELAIISTRPDRIGDAAEDAASAGCHCICEKPSALDRERLRAHYQALKSDSLHCIAMLNNVANPVLAAAAKLVRNGRLGDVVLCNARKSYKFGARPDWFGDRSIYGGTIPWVGIHALDFIHAVTGLFFVRVAAMHSNLVRKLHPGCEDNCAICLELDNGGHATASLDYLRPEAAETHGDDWLRVAGSRGVAEAYMARGACTMEGESGGRQNVPPEETKPFYVSLLQDLAAGNHQQPGQLTARSFMLADAALAARDAADTHRTCPIERGPWHKDIPVSS